MRHCTMDAALRLSRKRSFISFEEQRLDEGLEVQRQKQTQ
jgi:hypothetical protein